MSSNDALIELLREIVDPLGPIRITRLFGGRGIYIDGAFCAYVNDGTLYFKTDEAGRAAFEAEGMGPFEYQTKNGPGVLLSYWQAPERLLDDPGELRDWARRALAISRRKTAPGREKKKRAAERAPPKSNR